MEKDTVPLNGGLLIHKKAGMTSFDVIRTLRRSFPNQKWGHSGTLDPFATGVLVILLGNATRLQDELHLLPKTYKTKITLGATSDTDDATGKITPFTPDSHSGLDPESTSLGSRLVGRDDNTVPSQEQILSALETIKNKTSQIPPMYAAIKVAGKKMYEYARKGESVERKARPITIHEIHLENYTYPTLEISVTCSTGTYIRAIARDIGDILGTGAHCSTLTRTAIGPFILTNSYKLEDLPEDLKTVVIPPEQLVNHIQSMQFSNENVAKLKSGREVESAKNILINTPIALLDSNKMLIGIGIQESEDSFIKPKKIFLH